MTGDSYQTGMARLAAMWPGRSPDGDTAAVYADALGHLDDTVWERAITMCLRECTFYPVPAEILQRAEWILTEAGVLPDTPEDAWSQVLMAARSSRPGESTGLDPMTREVLQTIGGIYAVKIAEGPAEIAALRRQFLDIYGSMRQRLIRRSGALAQPLPASSGMLMAETIAHG